MSLIMVTRLRGWRRRRAAAHFFESLTQGLELADDVLDVRRERLERLEVAAVDRELNRLGDRLVELGVEESEAIARVSAHRLDALGRRQLRLQRRHRLMQRR